MAAVASDNLLTIVLLAAATAGVVLLVLFVRRRQFAWRRRDRVMRVENLQPRSSTPRPPLQTPPRPNRDGSGPH